MKDPKNHVLDSTTIFRSLNIFYEDVHVDIVKYTLRSNHWWHGRKAIVLKNYSNFSGDRIQAESLIVILWKMQKRRFDYYLHTGLFYVRDLDTGVEIGGIDYNDILLLPNQHESLKPLI